MAIIEFIYTARCKHCRHLWSKTNPKTNRYQSFCRLREEFIRKNDEACKDFQL